MIYGENVLITQSLNTMVKIQVFTGKCHSAFLMKSLTGYVTSYYSPQSLIFPFLLLYLNCVHRRILSLLQAALRGPTSLPL